MQDSMIEMKKQKNKVKDGQAGSVNNQMLGIGFDDVEDVLLPSMAENRGHRSRQNSLIRHSHIPNSKLSDDLYIQLDFDQDKQPKVHLASNNQITKSNSKSKFKDTDQDADNKKVHAVFSKTNKAKFVPDDHRIDGESPRLAKPYTFHILSLDTADQGTFK